MLYHFILEIGFYDFFISKRFFLMPTENNLQPFQVLDEEDYFFFY